MRCSIVFPTPFVFLLYHRFIDYIEHIHTTHSQKARYCLVDHHSTVSLCGKKRTIHILCLQKYSKNKQWTTENEQMIFFPSSVNEFLKLNVLLFVVFFSHFFCWLAAKTLYSALMISASKLIEYRTHLAVSSILSLSVQIIINEFSLWIFFFFFQISYVNSLTIL